MHWLDVSSLGRRQANIHVIENHMDLPDWREYLMDPGESLPVSRCVTPPLSAKSTSQASAVPEAFMQAFMAQFAAMSAAAANCAIKACMKASGTAEA